MHLHQKATAIAIAIGSVTTVIVPVQAVPPLKITERQIVRSPQPVNNTTNLRRYGRGRVALGLKIETVSGDAEIALAEYLAAKDVKFYGAYWCSHCQKQKSLFGATAAAKLPYIECAAGGENSQRQLCKEKKIEMFPTWVINGQYFPGTRDLKDIARMSGYQGPIDFKYRK